MIKKYKNRIVDSILQRKLSGKGAVLIEGPKWCGKSTTAKQLAGSVLDLGSSKTLEQSIEMAMIDINSLLKGDTPRLIDEWQLIPTLWDEVRSEVDKRATTGQYILTGSSVPADPSALHHSGTGRITHLKMRTMSLFESGEGLGLISLQNLFDGHSFDTIDCNVSLEEMAYLLCRGGWPEASMQNGDIALDQAFDYFDAIVSNDISRVDGVRRSKERTMQIMRSYARNQGHQIPYSTICADIKSNDSHSISDDTVADYVDALRKLFVVEDMPAWNPNLRSKAAIRTSENRYFVDSSIATAALGAGPNDLMDDLKTFGMLFECMAVRDLRIYSDAMNGQVYHYRDSNGLECDSIIHLRDGRYALIEIKLGGLDNIEHGATTIKALTGSLDFNRMKQPAFSMVVTAVGKYAYRRKDGIFVVPLSLLRP